MSKDSKLDKIVLKVPSPYQLGSLNGTDGQPTKVTLTFFAFKFVYGISGDPVALPMIVDTYMLI